MLFLYTTLIVLVSLLVLLNVDRSMFFKDARHRGKLLGKGRPTMFDVRHLLMEGQKEMAIQVYCEIFHTVPAKAKKDVEELERSLKV